VLRLVDELIWALRREGFPVSTAQAIDVARAVELVGFGDRGALRDAVGAVVVERATERGDFRQAFERFFAPDRAHAGDLWARLRERGFSEEELGVLRELLEAIASSAGAGRPALAALAGHDGELDALLASSGVARGLASMTSPLQVGFFAHRVMSLVGVPAAAAGARRVRDALRGALGVERGTALADALAEEVERMRRRVRSHVERTLEERTAELEGERRALEDRPFSALSPAEVDEVRRAVRRVAEKLRGAARVRRRHASRGGIDPHRTLRQSLRTGGVPFRPARRRHRRDRPRLWVLCDVSDSVRAASRFMLELVGASQELFAGTRSFVFVSELGETTSLFEEHPLEEAFARIASGRVVSVAENSNYGRVLRTFEERHGRELDRRTTLVVLGDGRTNHHGDELDVVRRLRERCRAFLWVCPEGRGSWGSGDSAMLRYAQAVTKVLVARTARELEDAARELVARR
jgi:hypothetical protein